MNRRVIAFALVLTLSLGVWLRSALAGWVGLGGLDFAHLRHAHSHLGAYGVLFPLAWFAWQRRGVWVPGPWMQRVYTGAVGLAVVGFVRAGYGPEAIVGSTVVGGIWLVGAWKLRRSVFDWNDALAPVPVGIVAAMACVPNIALTLRRDPELAQRWVATFLGVLLLVAVTPSAVAVSRAKVRGAPLLGVAGLLGAAALGVWPEVPARIGLAGFGVWLASLAASRVLDAPTRVSWGLLGGGLLALASGLLPHARSSIIGAVHFLVLGPVLLSLSSPVREVASKWRWALLAGIGLLTAPLVAQGLGVMEHTLALSAVGGLLVFATWVGLLLAPVHQP